MLKRFITSLLWKFLLGAGVLWALGLVWFAGMIPAAPGPSTASAEAIIVLTGGGNRLERGFELLREGRGRALLISGVGAGVTLGDLLLQSPGAPDLSETQREAITLGYAADSTATNAAEAQSWVEERGIDSILLVTANYHMPRSLLEFSALMPELSITPEPVFPENFSAKTWWKDGRSLKLVLLEYHKFLIVWFRVGN